MIYCFVINLDRSPERWERISRFFGAFPEIILVRVPAIDVSRDKDAVSPDNYSPYLFRLLNGRNATDGEIGCYLSHLKALKMFLETDAEYAVVCEDDIRPESCFAEIIQEAVKPPQIWNLLRLGQCRKKNSVEITELSRGIHLKICVKGFAYSGAELFDRKAAEFCLQRLAKIKVPWDLAIHRGWNEIREASLLPGIYVLDETSKESTLGNRKGKTSLFSPFWQTAQLYKIFSRCIRYSIQKKRICELKRNRKAETSETS